ncbi:uncharacterized protein LOC112569358 [Pomacea canaliculata]|uniref:uncharacterized protein LOC112569358 n=1 Tax=Pomacea canaliculata TaxID=400727 RepID=UPI000D73E58E|nr:uncharacterized protein LOC112569358 [Pomacea canaliculata]
MKVVILSCLLAAVLGVGYDEVQRSFAAVDLDGDGVIQRDELMTVFERKDTNKDKTITIEEYTATQLPGTPELVIQGNFNYYDKQDGAADGVISLSIVPVLFDIFDADDDGEITLEDCQSSLPQILNDIQNEIVALYAA